MIRAYSSRDEGTHQLKRLCFVGNSHVGAIRLALSECEDIRGVENAKITIFGSAQHSLQTAKVRNGVICSDEPAVQKSFRNTSGMGPEIAIADFDEIHFVLGASCFSVQPFVAGDDVPAISRAMFDVIWNGVTAQWPFKLARQVAKASETTRVTFIGSPYVSNESPFACALSARVSQPESNTFARILALRHKIQENVAHMGPENFQIFGPPDGALDEHGLFTRHEFCRGAKWLDEDGNTRVLEDFHHMNASYGKLLLENLLEFQSAEHADGSG